MILSNCNEGDFYKVIIPAVPRINKEKLYKFGITTGTKLRLIQKNTHGAVIIELRGARYALNPALSGGIIVEKAESERKHE